LTQQQYLDKIALMHTAAVMAAAIMPPGAGQAASEANFNTQHARCYQYLVAEAMSDETVYFSPPAIGAGSGGGAPALTQSALLAAITKALSNTSTAAQLTAEIAQLIGVAAPSTAPVTSTIAAIANAVGQTPASVATAGS
jgi:hypothetical protein